MHKLIGTLTAEEFRCAENALRKHVHITDLLVRGEGSNSVNLQSVPQNHPSCCTHSLWPVCCLDTSCDSGNCKAVKKNLGWIPAHSYFISFHMTLQLGQTERSACFWNERVYQGHCVWSVSFLKHSGFPPLWSSGQSSWLQIQRSSSGSGTGSTQPREDNWRAIGMESIGSGLENRN
jgi:hypothetical protein